MAYVGRENPSNIGRVVAFGVILASVLLVYMAMLSGASIVTMVRDLMAFNLRSIDSAWRLMFFNFSQAYEVSESGNFRNAIASLLFVFVSMSLPVWKLKSVKLAIILCSILIVLFLSISGILMLILLVLVIMMVRYPLIAFGAMIGLLTIVLLGGVLSADLMNSEYIDARLAGSTEGRLGHIELAWEDIQRSGYLGKYVGYQILSYENHVLYPHNMFVGIWLNGGIAGVLNFSTLYLVLFIACALRVTNSIFSSNPDYLALSGAMALFPFLLRSQVGSPVSYFADYGSAVGIAYFMAIYCLRKKQALVQLGRAAGVR